MINRIQNKSFCLNNICACTVYIYYVYINTSGVKINALMQELKIFNTGAGLGLATPFTNAASVSFFL